MIVDFHQRPATEQDGQHAAQGTGRRQPLEAPTIAELVEREGIASSYVARVLQLALLAPGIVEAIIDGKQARR